MTYQWKARNGRTLETKDDSGGKIDATAVTAEVKKQLDLIQKAWHDFKEQNTKEMAEIKAKGAADVVTAEQVNKLNEELDNLQKGLDDLAKKASRTPRMATDADKAEIKAVEAFAKMAKIDDLDKAAEARAEYRKAFDAFMRKGGNNGDNLSADERKALSVGSNPDGGFMVEPARSTDIIQKVFETSDVRRYAGQITIGTKSLEIPLDRDEASVGWVGETESRAETDTPQIGEIEIKVHELYAKPKATQNLLDDALIDMEAWLADKVSDKFARTENAAFLNGNGVKQPRGILTLTTATTGDDTRTFGQLQHVITGASGAFAADPNGPDALFDVVYALKAAYRGGAVFAMNRATAGVIRKMQDSDGQYMWQPSIQAGQPASLLGYPVAEWEDMPDIGANSLSVAFGNFRRGYLIVDRQGIRVLRDPYSSKPYVEFYSTKRVGGDVVDSDAIKLVKFTN